MASDLIIDISKTNIDYLYLLDRGWSNQRLFKTLDDIIKDFQPDYAFIRGLIEKQIEEYGETTLADNTTIYKHRVYGLDPSGEPNHPPLNLCVGIGRMCLATTKFLEENDIHQILQRENVNIVPVSAQIYSS